MQDLKALEGKSLAELREVYGNKKSRDMYFTY